MQNIFPIHQSANHMYRQMISVSGTATLDSLLPVQLPQERLDEFKAIFHPAKLPKGQVLPGTIKVADDKKRTIYSPYHALSKHIAYTSAYFNGLQVALRRAYRLIPYWQSVDEDIGRMISVTISQHNTHYEARTGAERPKEAEDFYNEGAQFLGSMRTGQHHIILDSEKHKGGKCIMFVGARASGARSLATLSAERRDSDEMPELTNTLAYQTLQNNGNLENEYCSAVLELAQDLLHAFAGLRIEHGNCYLRSYKQIPINTKFDDLFSSIVNKSALVRKLRVNIALPKFSSHLKPDDVVCFGEYFSILGVYDPTYGVVNTKLRATGDDTQMPVAIPSIALSARIGFSICFDLPADIVSYITQSKENERPSLSALTVWSNMWAQSMLRPEHIKREGGLKPSAIPTYVLMPSRAADLVKARQESGLYTEPGRCDEEHLAISASGNLNYVPAAAEVTQNNAGDYEENLEKALELSFSAGTPLLTGQAGSTDKLFDLTNPEYAKNIGEMKKKISGFRGSVQAINWDMNNIISVSAAEGDKFVSSKITGSTAPNAQNLVDYMKKPFSQSFYNMFSDSRVVDPSSRKPTKINPASMGDFSGFQTSSVFLNFLTYYGYALDFGYVPSLEDLVKEAAASLGIKALTDEKVAPYEIDIVRNRPMYKNFVDAELNLVDLAKDRENLTNVLGGAILQALADASGSARTNLGRYCARENIDVADDPHFFDFEGPLHSFANVYNYFGGRVFYFALKHVASLTPKQIQRRLEPLPFAPVLRFQEISTEIIPFAKMMSTYIVDKRDAIFKKAEELDEQNRVARVAESEIRLPGSKLGKNGSPGMQMLPHQAEDCTILANHPKYVIFDISPGGGKTTEGIIDMGMIYNEHLIDRVFFVICPANLVRNWVEDLHKHTEGRWNAIPITSDTYNSWGDARLTEMIQKAPRNTVVIVGNSFLNATGNQQVVIGNAVDKTTNAVEFIKKFSPEYVLIDESQRIRNPGSALHSAVKSICTMSSIKFIREATGTLIQNVMSDVVGQAAMCNGQIFRTKDDFDNTHKKPIQTPDGRLVYDYSEETPKAARERLNEFATVLSHKQKDWAFMLPIPIETLIRVSMENSGAEDDKLGKAHKMFYDAVLKQTMAELRANDLIKKQLKKMSIVEETEEADDEEGGKKKPAAKKASDEKVALPSGVKIDTTNDDDDSDNLDELEAALQPYLQRLERLLTDPLGDEDLAQAAHAFFGNVKREDFVTAKVRKTVERIVQHMTPNPWQRGAKYKPSTLVDYDGKTYICRSNGLDSGELVSNKPPVDDPDNWREQIRGKVLVICRYTRSCEAVLRALPRNLRARALAFHGSTKEDKNENLNRYKTDSKIDILVCNETAISEGHNLQMTGRMIRIEAPWAPGELDQTAARMFRPDVEGKYPRETVFLDWIITDGSLEVAKMGRLISKMSKKASFDEFFNEKYYGKLKPKKLPNGELEQGLPVISMSLDNIERLNSFDDLCSFNGEGNLGNVHSESYVGMYQYLVHEKAAEFREMKTTKRAFMVDVTPTPMPEDAKIIEYTPWVANMRVPDRADDGLVSLNEILQDDSDPITIEAKKNRDSLKGKFVRTELGLGVIHSFTSKQNRNKEEGDDGGEKGISKVKVELANGDIVTVGLSKLFLATKVTAKSIKGKSKNAPKITEEDKERTGKFNKQAEEEVAKSDRRKKKADQEISEEAPSGRKQAGGKIRPDSQERSSKTLPAVELHPAVYNRFLTLEAIMPEEKDKTMCKLFGFTKFGKYAFIGVKHNKSYNQILDWIEAKFTLSAKTTGFLEQLFDTFQTGRGEKFDVEQASPADLPKFLQTNHRLTTVTNPKKPEVKFYPLVVHSKLFLVVDLATNPVFQKYVGKPIPNTSPVVKIGEADGMDIAFYRNKSDLVNAVKLIRDSGKVTIANYSELKEEIKALDLKPVVSSRGQR